jgi:hypothetical protein
MNEQWEKIFQTLGILLIANVVVSVGFAGWTMYSITGISSLAIGFISGIVVGVILFRVIAYLSLHWVIHKWHGGDLYDFFEEAKRQRELSEKPRNKTMRLKIEVDKVSPDFACHFKDQDVPTWIEVKTPKGNYRFNYDGILNVDFDKGNFVVPDDCLLLEPGVLYRVDGPVKEDLSVSPL